MITPNIKIVTIQPSIQFARLPNPTCMYVSHCTLTIHPMQDVQLGYLVLFIFSNTTTNPKVLARPVIQSTLIL